jgi:hypothetical protein
VSWICVGLPGDVWGRCLEERAGNEGNPVFLFAVSGSNTIASRRLRVVLEIVILQQSPYCSEQ